MKRIVRLTIFSLILTLSPLCAKAQLNLPVKEVNGNRYYFYQVKKKETLHGVAKQLGISTDDILKYNPSVAQGFVNKQLIFFPVSEFSKDNALVSASASKLTPSGETVVHTVQRGETLYGIAKTYGVSESDILAANPGNDGALRSGETIYIPQPKKEVQSVVSPNVQSQSTQNELIYHTIIRGESLYSVAKKYNTTIEGLLSLNPGVSPDHFQAGDVIKVMPNSSKPIMVEKDVTKFYTHEVKKGDTFNSIARLYGISVESLQAANPGIEEPKKGKTIYVPKNSTETVYIDPKNISEKELENSYASKIDTIYNDINNIKHDNEINLGIILPFQLHKSNPPKQALLYTEFYRGFLLGIDSVRRDTGKKIHLMVYDTEHNLNKTDSILALPELKSLDFIVAPGEPKQLARVNEFGKNNGINVLNCFTLKNEDYLNNPRVFQVNIPSSYLVGNVAEWFDSQFKDYNVIFLDDPESQDNDIFSELEQHINDVGFKTNKLTIIHELTFANLSKFMDPGTKYVFVPTSGSKTLLGKVIKALKKAKTDRFDCDMVLFGHPEYCLYLRDFQEDMMAIDTYLYARYFNSRGYRYREIERRYNNWFHESMLYTAPTMGLLGFDVAHYLIRKLGEDSLFREDTERFDGIQTNFKFQRTSNWGGFINNSVDIIHFAPDHTILDIAR